MKIFDVLQNFPFTTSETKPGYLKQTGICELSQELPNYLRLKNFRIMLKSAQSSSQKENLPILAKDFVKVEIEPFPHCAIHTTHKN